MRSVVLCSRWHFVFQVWGFTAGFWFTETHGSTSAFSANADVANADIAVLQRRKGLPNPLGWLIPYPGRCGKMLKSGIPKSTALSLVARQPRIQNPYILNHWVNPMGLDRIGTNCWQSWVPVAADVRPFACWLVEQSPTVCGENGLGRFRFWKIWDGMKHS